MNYVFEIDEAIDVFQCLSKAGESQQNANDLLFALELAQENTLLKRLFALLDDKEIFVEGFTHSAPFEPVDGRRRLTNYLEFISYLEQNKQEGISLEAVNFIFRHSDIEEWEMYAILLQNRFSAKAEPVELEEKEQPVHKTKQPHRKQKNKNTKQAGK